jgi:hypothetical protein
MFYFDFVQNIHFSKSFRSVDFGGNWSSGFGNIRNFVQLVPKTQNWNVPLLTFRKPPPMDLQIDQKNQLVYPFSILPDASSSSTKPRVQKRNLDLHYEDQRLFR